MTAADTIAAVASPPGQGAIALVRVSGDRARETVRGVFSGKLNEPRRQQFGHLVAADGATIDEVLVTWFQAPRSYTGEDVVEISCHGGLLVTRAVLDRLLEAGARPAEPGEFSQRAFLNGKMDLTQAEAVMDLISARTDLARRAAHEQLAGRLGEALGALREDLIGIVAHVEAYIDFPEEDIDPDTGATMLGRIDAAREAVARLLATADQGRLLREGVRTVICGAPNAGKSSLLNRLLGFDRAIVSETPGTTRDTIEEVIDFHGLPLRLIDTAGVRESADSLEREGIARTLAQLDNADLAIEVIDASLPGPDISNRSGVEIARHLPAGARHLRLLNKADLGLGAGRGGEADDGLPFSCRTGEGMESLTAAIFRELGGPGANWGADLVAINARHKRCLARAADDLERARESLAGGASPEFAALDLRAALDAVGEVVGKADVEEILGEIFGRFCIGK